jgi:hypothetical protein
MNIPILAPIAGPVGHIADLFNLLRFTYANPHSFSKYRQLIAVARRTGARVLIETGTFRGVTTRRCARHFSRIYTIELDHDLAVMAKRTLKAYRNCEVIEGDATREVTKILKRSDVGNDLLLFLDGHFSGIGTARGECEEPALDVLKVIANHKRRVAGIVIDDFREFGCQPGWPTKGELLKSVEQLFPGREFTIWIHMDQVLVMRNPRM